ncbi:hypothetical protein BLNAU_7338 [Blattamonas nauphoetae]|uniref:U-box domain-containing protein n=1 Tax=Blattamonas nauphoetae TaxID=2049346 RepID=A0ABQ9Y1W1_9EUKA|nr:hypothetical protein BLNAU_7338 [Blattamonas nauphoetae]
MDRPQDWKMSFCELWKRLQQMMTKSCTTPSAKGSLDLDSDDWAIFHLRYPHTLVKSITVTFTVHTDFDHEPVYPSQQVGVDIGPDTDNWTEVTVVHSPHSKSVLVLLSHRPEPLAILLPFEPIGEFLRLRFIGKRQCQFHDRKFFVCVSHVSVLGTSADSIPFTRPLPPFPITIVSEFSKEVAHLSLTQFRPMTMFCEFLRARFDNLPPAFDLMFAPPSPLEGHVAFLPLFSTVNLVPSSTVKIVSKQVRITKAMTTPEIPLPRGVSTQTGSFNLPHLPSNARLASALCPIIHIPFSCPAVAADGLSYEKQAIEQWFISGYRTSPVTGQPLQTKWIIPNLTLLSLLESLHDGQNDDR